MPVDSTKIKQYGAISMPTDNVAASGGGIDAANEIDNSSIGEFIPTHIIDPVADTGWYYKICHKNTHLTDDWYNVRFYVKNLLIDIVAAGIVAIASSSSSDDNTKMVRVIGECSLGNETHEDVTLNGTTVVYTVLQFVKIHRIEFRNLASPYALTAAHGDVTITRGITLGIIPATYNGAVGEVSVALDEDIDGINQSVNRLNKPQSDTPTPVDLVFTKPNSLSNAIACTGLNQTIPALSYQGIWIHWETEALAEPSEDIPLWIVGYGTAAS